MQLATLFATGLQMIDFLFYILITYNKLREMFVTQLIRKGSCNPMYPIEYHCYEFVLFSEPNLGLFGAQLWNSLCWQSVEYCNNHFRCHPEDVYHRMKTSKLWWISKDPHPPSQPHFPLTSNFLTWGNIWSPDSFSEDITITSTTKKCFRSKKK